jgi:hypothetical protein
MNNARRKSRRASMMFSGYVDERDADNFERMIDKRKSSASVVTNRKSGGRKMSLASKRKLLLRSAGKSADNIALKTPKTPKVGKAGGFGLHLHKAATRLNIGADKHRPKEI